MISEEPYALKKAEVRLHTRRVSIHFWNIRKGGISSLPAIIMKGSAIIMKGLIPSLPNLFISGYSYLNASTGFSFDAL